MHPTRIRLQNIGPHKDTDIAQLCEHSPLACLAPNETGKSYLVGALAAALGGSYPDKPGSLYKHVSWGERKGRIEVEFEDLEQEYKVIVELSVTNSGGTTKAYLMIKDGDTYTDLAGPSVTEFKAVVAERFGSQATYLASSFAVQGAAGDLTSASRNTRYDVFAEMIEAKELLKIGDQAKETKELVAEDQVRIEVDLARAESLASSIEEVRAEYTAKRAKQADLNVRLGDLLADKEDLLTRLAGKEALQAEEAVIVSSGNEAIKQLALLDQEGNTTKETLDRARARHKELSLISARAEDYSLYQNKVSELEAERDDHITWANYITWSTPLNNTLATVEKNIVAYRKAVDSIPLLEEQIETYRNLLKEKEAADVIYQEWFADKQAFDQYQQQATRIQKEIDFVTYQFEEVTKHLEVLKTIPNVPGVCTQCPLVSSAMQRQNEPAMLQEKLATLSRELDALDKLPEPVSYEDMQSAQAIYKTSLYTTLSSRIEQSTSAIQEAKVAKRLLKEAQIEYDKVRAELNSKTPPNKPGKSLQDINRELAELQANIREIESLGIRNIVQSLEEVEKTIKELEKTCLRIEQDKQKLEAELSGMRKRQSEMTDLLHSYTRLEEELAQKSSSEQQIRGQLVEIAQDLEAKQKQIASLEAELKSFSSYKEKAKALQAKANRLAKLSTIFSRRGVLPLLIEHARPQIQNIANDLFEEAGYSESLLIKTESNTGSEVLDIFTVNEFGEHDISQFSGGRKQMIRMILRIAMCYWRAERSGKVFDSLILDEAFDALDSENRQILVNMLLALAKKLKLLIVISHTLETVQQIPNILKLEKRLDGVHSEWIT